VVPCAARQTLLRATGADAEMLRMLGHAPRAAMGGGAWTEPLIRLSPIGLPSCTNFALD
jgi:hypothetical protein